MTKLKTSLITGLAFATFFTNTTAPINAGENHSVIFPQFSVASSSQVKNAHDEGNVTIVEDNEDVEYSFAIVEFFHSVFC